ncbi:hypothetical protein VMCG_05685 [Cytospora schulzeri]|uniref:Gfd2/YDR514C-like C-terminal domain-containing protein n=1 Tax=Cytospora schulzeri TaxID=448051 RepID=A0A423WII6_9PEZI|nr:hypothetical protein VMCG_05685 [Valsa malicola]
MRHAADQPGDIYDKRNLENESELLLTLWELSDHKKICFVSFDLEGPYEAITELGLAFQRKNDSQRQGRHIIINSNQQKKASPPKPCGFGISSEELDDPKELYTILDEFFTHQRDENHRVVLTGFDMKADLTRLHRDCDWKPPTYVILMDSAAIYKTLSGKKSNPNQATALDMLGFPGDPEAPFHNAANDAWYGLELLFRKAEQAQRQHVDPGGDDTINWLVPSKTACPSPVLQRTSNLATRLSFPFDFNDGKPPRPPAHQPPQATQRPFSTSETALALRPSRKRKRRGDNQKGGPGEAVDATPSDDSAHNRPEKRQKLM